MSPASLAESAPQTGTPNRTAASSTSAPPAGKSRAPRDPAAGCPNCGTQESWGGASWCPQCGYYPALGTVAVTDVAKPQVAEEDEGPKTLLESIPRWGWVLGAGILATFAISLTARLLTTDGSSLRTYCTIGQCIVGVLLVGIAHAWAYFQAIMRTDKIAVFDFIFKPGAIWAVTFDQVPKSAPRVWMGAWGVSIIVFALAITGGINYGAIFEVDKKKKKPPSLIKQITKSASQMEGNGSDSLEEAVEDFAGKNEVKPGKGGGSGNGGGDDDDEDEEEAEPLPIPKPKEEDRFKLECVIMGYALPPDKSTFSELYLAATIDGKMRFVGTLTDGIPDGTRHELEGRLKKLRREKPFVRCRLEGKWLQPVLRCKVSFRDWNAMNLMNDARFEYMVNDFVKRPK